jgi:hypothetical protein
MLKSANDGSVPPYKVPSSTLALTSFDYLISSRRSLEISVPSSVGSSSKPISSVSSTFLELSKLKLFSELSGYSFMMPVFLNSTYSVLGITSSSFTLYLSSGKALSKAYFLS